MNVERRGRRMSLKEFNAKLEFWVKLRCTEIDDLEGVDNKKALIDEVDKAAYERLRGFVIEDCPGYWEFK